MQLRKYNSKIQNTVNEILHFPSNSKIHSYFFIFIGLILIILGVIATISWVIFCFGSIVIGLLLLFLFPVGLYAPFIISIIGNAIIHEALINLSYMRKSQQHHANNP